MHRQRLRHRRRTSGQAPLCALLRSPTSLLSSAPCSQPPSSERNASAAERIERANSRGSARSLLLSVWADAKINGLAVMCEQVNTMRTVEKAIKISR